MSWRNNLRPGSFRGVPFECTDARERGGQRGAHHQYPLRDQGWVQQLGLDDVRISLEAFVIGDDYMATRDRLIAALREPGNGELIHPWRGPLRVVVDPGAGWQITETERRGRMARFSLSFLVAPAVSTAPDAGIDGIAATDAAADAAEGSLLDTIADRLDLDAIDAVIGDVQNTMGEIFSEIDKARALAQRITALPGTVLSTILAPVSEFRQLALDVIGIGDAFAGIGAMLDGVSLGIGGRTRIGVNTSAPGARPAARIPVTTAANPDGSAMAALAALDRTVAVPASVPVVAANRDALDTGFDIALVSELARASVRQDHDSHGDAIGAMQVLDARIEREIRREADRPGPSDILIRQLSDLRHAAREAILARAADLAPIATVDIGQGMPVLAAAWQIHGSIAEHDDLILRNGIMHPLFAPSALDVRQEARRA